MKVVAIVGMSGAGKSEIARLMESSKFTRIRFGDITDEEIIKRGLSLNEQNERKVREALREEYGMAAYAMLNLSKIDLTRTKSDVVIDGLYSWEEYVFLKTYLNEGFYVLAVYTSPRTRYQRLKNRMVRPLTAEEAASRDAAEIINLNKAGPIALADFTIINESTMKDLKKEVKTVITRLSQL